ncbi:hypothetical protein HY375_01075 [Candidatus Berkelbacteria bacterium]|nr:hypothetical protein [Candidatus Berkelbacteria bacterium]
MLRPDAHRPVSKDLRNLSVPEILKSGDHARIAAWRAEQAVKRSKDRRGT